MRDKPTRPLAEGARHDMEPSRDHLAVRAFSTYQYDSSSARDRRGRSRSMCQRVQSVPFVFGHGQSKLGASRSHARLPVEQYERAALFVSVFMVAAH